MFAIVSEGTDSTAGYVYKCNRCSHLWVTRKTNGLPRSCPSCRSVIWNKTCNTIHCLHCDYEWVSTSSHPSRCPHCHTSKWDTPPVEVKVESVRRPKQTNPELLEKINNLRGLGLNAFEIARALDVSFQTVRDLVGPDFFNTEA